MEKKEETETLSVFATLDKIDVNEHTGKKNGLTYLSWAWAWREVAMRYPTAQYGVNKTDSGLLYWTDGKTCWVECWVEIEGIRHTEYFPVMDYKNAAIPLEKITTFDVNKSLQRGWTKAIARHGFGLYIYAGEDLPYDEQKNASNKNLEYCRQKIMECKTLEEAREECFALGKTGISKDFLNQLYREKKAELQKNEPGQNPLEKNKKNLENLVEKEKELAESSKIDTKNFIEEERKKALKKAKECEKTQTELKIQ